LGVKISPLGPVLEAADVALVLSVLLRVAPETVLVCPVTGSTTVWVFALEEPFCPEGVLDRDPLIDP